MKIAKSVRQTYRWYSNTGVEMMKHFIQLKEGGLSYWEATKEVWAQHLEKGEDSKGRYHKTAKRVRKMDWKP